jgi:hypothetical protein
MLARFLLMLAVALCVLCRPALATRVASNDITVKLSEHVHNYNLGTFTFVGALIQVSNDFEIPMGIVWINTAAARAQLAFAWKEATVLQVIEAIAKTQPAYQVEVAEGIVHVVGGIPAPENFLTLHIEGFRVDNDLTELASWKLHNLISPRHYAGFSTAASTDPKINLDLRDCTVEAALDALISASKRKIWVVTFLDDGSVTPKGLRRTLSLWSDKPAPDEDQPVWDLLHWGDPLPPLVAGTQSSGQNATKPTGRVAQA